MGASVFFVCDFQNHICSEGGGTDEKDTRRVRRAAVDGFSLCDDHALFLGISSLVRRRVSVTEFFHRSHVFTLSFSMELCRLVRPSPMLTYNLSICFSLFLWFVFLNIMVS